MGNERADTLGKMGMSLPAPCQHAVTTKLWLQTQARSQLLQRWKQELPLSNPSFTFPTHLHRVDRADTRALWRVFSIRSPSDPHPNHTADPCPGGQDLNTSHHLLHDCTLLAQRRSRMQLATCGHLESLTFLTNQANWLGLRNLLRATGLGHTKNISYDRQPTPLEGDGASDSDLPKPDFGHFKP